MADAETTTVQEIDKSRDRFDHKNPEDSKFRADFGLTREVVEIISRDKNEPEWMLKHRIKCLELFHKLPMPTWGPSLEKLNLGEISFYLKPNAKKNANKWEDVPDDIKKTFERLGIPEAERTALGGVGAQYESEIVYHSLKKDLAEKGVIFEDCDYALQHYPELMKKYFMKCVPPTLHKFAALHGAVWSGGTFLYVPKGIKVDLPLQAYFRMNAESLGQFEHTLIVVEEGAQVHYIEGCFTKGNLVTSNPDYKPIEDIKENEKVLTSEGEFKTTKDVQELPYTGEIYTISLYGDSTQKIEVTGDHPFLYVDKSRKNEKNKAFKPRWNIPKYFKKGDYLVVPINKEVKTSQYHEFEVMKGSGRHGYKLVKIKVPLINEFFRLVGYYLAEGSVSSDSYLNFSFNINETEYHKDVKYCLKKVFGVEKILEMNHKKNKGISLVVCSVELARVFKQFGNKNDKKAVLPWMMHETVEHQKEIIIGWFRGDGNYYNKISKAPGWLKEAFIINTTSEKLARQGRDILLRLGVVGFLNKRNREKDGRKTMYTLGVTGEYLQNFGNLVGIPAKSKLNNKKRASMFGINEKFAFLPIKSIVKIDVENLQVYNFGVEEHETYTVGGVAVHNCSAPRYDQNSLHAGCVEVFVHRNARARYSSIENWSRNTFNLNTKRANVYKNAYMEWVNGNMGSNITMLYPCSVLMEEGAKTDYLGVAFAGKGQNQDTGCKIYHLAKNTQSTVKAKSISKDGGITTYRGLLQVAKGATGSKANVLCDALMMDNISKSDTVPTTQINESEVDVGHEATVGKIDPEQIFYLTSRGISEDQATQMVVAGFIEPIVKELPLEYAVELNRLIQLEMEGSIG